MKIPDSPRYCKALMSGPVCHSRLIGEKADLTKRHQARKPADESLILNLLRRAARFGKKFFMKKVFALSLSVAMLAGALSACSSDKTEETTAVAEETTTTVAEETTTAEETEETTEATEETTETTEATEAAAEGSYKPQDRTFPMELTDAYGNTVTIESEPETIVSVSPALTEIVFALGEGDKLVGRTDYCDYPAEAMDIASVGNIDTPDTEKIVEIDPDLIIASSIFTEDSYNALTELGYTVVILRDEATLEGTYELIDTVSDVIGASEEGDKVIADMDSKITEIEAADDKDVTVYYCMGYGEYGEYTAGDGTFIDNMIEIAGAKNAADDADGWTYSLEALIAADPDYILVPAWGYDGFVSTEPYSDLTAVKEGHVISVDNNLFERQGPRNLEAIELIYNTINE